mmetsp:Transcript_29929/g.53569  ORF Transcript_29929/g.53569 Transcript_29929/m.53569 type:complete len:265 (-) Transcript_29929:93-887(-)|eukprot:CAMPEP_0177776798 /NCGR_PEP_ID=MMETSP0491_2-20121128/14918_1 /TAXON_ID=63592 /ORGANISM="Tetraselmis chuii, Strain PLY429" /LENGTH=264 /DNA_ID=CAMNT_0019295639 /DNA_START=146 /DNA_END=940 /DNA_ORIENTATION=-
MTSFLQSALSSVRARGATQYAQIRDAQHSEGSSSPRDQPQVVFLHGLGRRPASMKGLAGYVSEHTGLKCHVIGYPSMHNGLPELAEIAAQSIRDTVGEGAEVLAVTHSMGGVVVRHIQDLEDKGGVDWQGICMIAPPNLGSRVAHFLCQSWIFAPLFKAIFGAGAIQLAQIELARKWPMPPQPCVVIAGTRRLCWSNPTSWFTWLMRLLPGVSDGTIGVDETKLADEFMTDFATVSAAHTFIMRHQDVKRLVVNFIQHGSLRGE